MNQDLSRKDDIWAMNLATGDKYCKRKWKAYYNMDCDEPLLGPIREGCIIGVLVDMDRGIISFYKDGNDLGQAFVMPELKQGTLYPFIQT